LLRRHVVSPGGAVSPNGYNVTVTGPASSSIGSTGALHFHDVTRGEDDLGREQVVDRQPALAHEPPEPPAKGEAREAGGGDQAAGRRESVRLHLAIELAPGDSALGADGAAGGVDVDPLPLEGATSVSLVYDRVRALRARVTGRPDPARHGAVVSDPRKRGA
jgi:hypothetical protein